MALMTPGRERSSSRGTEDVSIHPSTCLQVAVFPKLILPLPAFLQLFPGLKICN